MVRAREIDSLYPTLPEGPSSDRWRDVRRFVKRRVIYDALLLPYGLWKHGRLAAEADLSQSHIYTAFFRVPAQFDALLGPVLDAVGVDRYGHRSEPLTISVLAGSIGAEAYTLAAILNDAVPDLDFEIECSDLHDENVERCRQGRYAVSEVLRHGIPAGLVEAMFDRSGDEFFVKDSIKKRVTFFQADIINDPLSTLHQRSDLVFVQNVFCHLDESQTERAFGNVLQIVGDTAALFIDGMPLDLRERLSSEANLSPVDFEIHKTHRQLRRHLPAAWWTKYYAVEPYIAVRRSRLRRYATVFITEGCKQ